MNWCICKHPAFGTTMNHAECSTARCSIGGVARGLPKSFRWNWTCVTIDHRTMNLCFVWFCQAMLLPMRHARMMFIQLRKNGTAQCYMIVYNIHSYTYTVYTPYFISIEYIYIYLENHKDKIFCPYGFGHVFCPLRIFSKYGHVRLQTLYSQVNLVNSFPELLDLSDWFRQYECLV